MFEDWREIVTDEVPCVRVVVVSRWTLRGVPPEGENGAVEGVFSDEQLS